MRGKFTKYPANFWQNVQLNAGILVSGFDPEDLSYTGILGATGDGTTFNPNPTYEDFGADIDNVPPNTKQLKRIQYYDPALSGTFRTISQALGAMLCPGTEDGGVITPADRLTDAMFQDVTLIADYSDINADDTSSGAVAGCMAVTVKNALNTSGFQWKTNKDGKGEFAFDFHGHYDLDSPDEPPFDLYIMEPTRPAAANSGGETTGGTEQTGGETTGGETGNG